jgi:RND family efflux transporter MFP subunit
MAQEPAGEGAEHATGPKAGGDRRPWTLIASGTGVVLVLGAALVWRADHDVNRVPLGAAPRPVSVVEAEATTFRPSRSYVGTLEPWVEASVGPQFVAAYVDTVLVRPGDPVARGQVLATLDCSDEAAESQAIAMRARAIDEQQRALADEASRVTGLLDGGFVAKNDAEQSAAKSATAQAELLETKAKLTSASLRVHDCVLRAPFTGEIGTRSADPGAFVRPGAPIVAVVDRRTIRVTAEAPERDFELVAPATVVKIDVLATGKTLTAKISRRAPKADPRTRTVLFEIDVPDPERVMPVGTTGVVRLEVGAPLPAAAVPSYAATVRGGKAKIFVVEGDRARARAAPIVGESGGRLYLDPAALPPHANVVTEGRALLSDGDAVKATPEAPAAPPAASGEARGGGFGRPL